MRTHFTLLIFTLMAVLALSACSEATPQPTTDAEAIPAEYAGKTNPLANNAGAAAAGKNTYEMYCASCHGASGRGDGPAGASMSPSPANLVELNKSAADDFLFWRITRGKAGTSMVPWENVVTEEQTWQVVTYIRTMK